MDRIDRRRRTIPGPLDQRTLSKPPNRRSWSSKDVKATHASRERHRQRWLCLVQSLDRPTSLVATVDAYRASRNRRCHRAWDAMRRRRSSTSVAPSPLARSPRERRRRSFLVECCRQSPVSGQHHRWPPGSSSHARQREPSPPIARSREPPPPLKPNPWRRGGVYIAARTWFGWTECHRWAKASSSYWKPRTRNIQSIYIYIYREEVMEALGFR
jgi:hypothetical protein